jgi:hypothetical protein
MGESQDARRVSSTLCSASGFPVQRVVTDTPLRRKSCVTGQRCSTSLANQAKSLVVEICLHGYPEIDIPEIRYSLAAVEQDGPIEIRLDRHLPSAERDLRIAAGSPGCRM